MRDALVIIPTYNEAENIPYILVELDKYIRDRADILVVDDNSPDGTKQVAEKSPVKPFILSRHEKDGLSQAYQAGFRWALERNYKYVVQMDADFSHRPSDVPRLLEALKYADVAIGCRYTKGGGTVGWSQARKFVSVGGNRYAQLVLNVPYKDMTGGFNGWRREVLEAITDRPLVSKGYAFQVELKYRAHQEGFRLMEVPICFEERRSGHSKMSKEIVFEAAWRVFEIRRNQKEN